MGGQDQVKDKIREKVTNDYIKDTSQNKLIQQENDMPSFWRDAFPYFLPGGLMFMYAGVYAYTGNVVLGAAIIYFLTPLYNMFVLDDERNLTPKVEKAYIQTRWMFLLPAHFCIFSALAIHIWCFALYSTNYKPDWFILQHKPETWPQIVIFSFIIGFFGASASTAGHELVHWPETFNKFIGNIPYMQAFYSHFWDEHVHSHHRHIATDEDPVCHNKGVSLYRAIPSAVAGTHVASWNREMHRLNKIHKGNVPLNAKIFDNKMVYYQVMHVFMLWSIYQVFGVGGLKVQGLAVLQGWFWDELINYIEHYGLRRVKDKDGIMEAVGYMHSWSALASPVAFKIQRHSDHHAHKFRPYQILRRFERAPTMPYEYILMLWLAFCPPMWNYIVDPIVKSIDDHKAGIYNPDKWNNEMPMSEDDKVRDKHAK